MFSFIVVVAVFVVGLSVVAVTACLHNGPCLHFQYCIFCCSFLDFVVVVLRIVTACTYNGNFKFF